MHFRYPPTPRRLCARTRREALCHRPGRWAIVRVEEFHLGRPGEEELAFRAMWRQFYDTIAIRERENPRCRMTHMPKRYWDMMTEFREDWDSALPELPRRTAP